MGVEKADRLDVAKVGQSAEKKVESMVELSAVQWEA